MKLSSLIKLTNISKTYFLANHPVNALKNIHLDVVAGEMLAIVGQSGSGKSTLMNIMGCLDRASGGNYILSGTDVSVLKEPELASIRNHKIGFVFQTFFLLPRLNALQNVMLPLHYRGLTQREAESSAKIMLHKVGLAAALAHLPSQLSGGQQQRVAIARALVGHPDIILADEPTGSLDSETGHGIMQLLIDLNRNERRTIVIITHDRTISAHCSRVVTLKDGVLIET